MPKFRIPRQSSPHRIAAIALYRALLTQCRAAPFEEPQRNELQNIIRNRFKHAQHSHSHRLLRVSFEAGYEAVDHLDAAVAGDEESKAYLVSLLDRAPSKIKLPPEPKPLPKKDRKRKNEVGDEATPREVKPSLFDRPLPLTELSGKRRVPVLFSANRIPVLRIKKPQPESLSRYIRQRIAQRQKWHDTRARLSEERELAKREDEWDDLIATDGVAHNAEGWSNVEFDEPTWAATIVNAISEVQGKIDQEKEKNRIMAEKMQGVVDREKALFDEERAAEREARKTERLAKDGQVVNA